MTDAATEEDAQDRLIGSVLQDRYRIVRKLGEGGMGAVYEGEHVLIKRRVAIKVLHAHFASNAEVAERFHREAMATNKIGSEHIVEVTDMGRFDDGSTYMVLEYLAGQDVSQMIESEGPQPLGRVVHIASQICDALDAAHAAGIVHRDMKPENVFLVTRQNDPDFVKVLDFGISKFKDASNELGGKLTQTGMTMGTPHYMAPEQAQGLGSVDHRADIYALGVILFHALTGHHPFEAETLPMLVLKICTEPPPPILTYRPDLPQELADILARTLAKEPEQRFAACSELKAALEPFRAVTAAPVLTDAPAPSAGAPSVLTQNAAAAPVPAVSVVRSREDTFAGVAGLSKSKLPWILGGLGLLGVGGIAAAALVLSKASSPEQPPPSPAVIAEPTPVAEETEPEPEATPEPAAAPAPALVRIEISTDPKSAELFLDGDRVANPFNAELPVSDEPRRLEAKRRGYKTVVQDLVLKYGQTVTIDMKRGRGTDDRRRAVADTEQGSTEPSTAKPPAATAKPTFKRPSQVAAVNPGADDQRKAAEATTIAAQEAAKAAKEAARAAEAAAASAAADKAKPSPGRPSLPVLMPNRLRPKKERAKGVVEPPKERDRKNPFGP